MQFADHFSAHASAYADARPSYPDALFDWLATLCEERRCAWDAGCGNGQATLALAAHFEQVIGSDPSSAQIAAAPAHPRIRYRVEPAEAPTLADQSVDLVLVAQALHWFDQTRFHASVQRVLRPGGVFAAASYGLCEVSAMVDPIFNELYRALDPYWPAERRHVETGYRELPFPYVPISAPEVAMTQSWTLPQYLAYLQTWSASQRCLKETGVDPVRARAAQFVSAWGEPEIRRDVRWPLTLRVGRHA